MMVMMLLVSDATRLHCTSAPDPAPDHVKLAWLQIALQLVDFRDRRIRELRTQYLRYIRHRVNTPGSPCLFVLANQLHYNKHVDNFIPVTIPGSRAVVMSICNNIAQYVLQY